MERADVHQDAALETAAPPTVERQREQQRIQAPAYIIPRDPRLLLSSLAETQPGTTPAQPLHSGSVAAAVDSGSPASAKTVLERRVQQRKAVPPNQRQCLQCGGKTPGAGQNWTRHPATKEEWMCSRCYQRARRQLKRKPKHEAAPAASSSDGDEASWQDSEEAQPPSQSPPSPQQQAASVQPPLPGPPVQQHVPATVSADGFAEAGQQQHLQALSQQQQQQLALNPDAARKTATERPALLPAHDQQPQASTGLLVLEAAQHAAAAAAGLTEGLAGTFAALLPMPAEQDECLRLMLQRRQYSGAAGLMRAVLHVRGIPG
ncbi:hypothetical protein D9Q98_004893 [Chlorella vulgaris]|uniref:Uncharacterized protein n=1 Tax=Chlorella vulgaris TaxID=3077 RepID=A0A9D4TN56_CHLVU|nr:hypothetical protein D9Q98_004893 [Chlorella vulgaris]